MGIDPKHVWPYHSQFVAHSIDFAHSEIFHDALLTFRLWDPVSKPLKLLFMTS